jgi:exosortase
VFDLKAIAGKVRDFFVDEEPATGQSRSYRNWHWGLVAISLILGTLFLAPTYATRMWNAGHYQYFPLVFVAVAGLLWANRGDVIKAAGPSIPWVVGTLLLAVTVQLVIANILYSGFLGVLAVLVGTLTGYYIAFGVGGLKVALPVLLLLLLAVPLPLKWDERLIVEMQLIASQYASRFLDGIGVTHFRQGVILQTAQTKFLTEEACSGIRSLFSSWAVVAIYGVAMGHRWWRLLINLLQTVLWVIIGNVLRIVVVVAFAERAPWLASGWGHEFLGLCVFGFILLMVAMTDIAISEIIAIELVVEPTTDDPIIGRLVEETTSTPQVQLPPFPLTGRLRKSVLVGSVLLVLIGFYTTWVRSEPLAEQRPETVSRQLTPDEGVLPETLAGMKRVSFRHDLRGPNYLWALSSFVWEYSDDRLRAIISLDSPWDQWHNLNVCYTNIGWVTEARYGIEASEDAKDATMPNYRRSELVMRRSRQSGFVVFSAIDRAGRPVIEPTSSDRFSPFSFAGVMFLRLWAGLGFGSKPLDVITPDRLPIETVQLYAESMRPLTDQDHEKLRRLFSEARRELVAWKVRGGERQSIVDHQNLVE